MLTQSASLEEHGVKCLAQGLNRCQSYTCLYCGLATSQKQQPRVLTRNQAQAMTLRPLKDYKEQHGYTKKIHFKYIK